MCAPTELELQLAPTRKLGGCARFRVEFRPVRLTDLLTSAEGKTLEFKRDLSSRKGVLRTIVAFANTAGGTLLVGVEDGTRHVRGVADPLAMEERIASLVTDSITPRVLPEIDILPWRSTHVVAVSVHPSTARPHHLTREGPERGTYVRVGSTNRRADADLIASMARFARQDSFDEQPMPELDSEAVDFRVASECFAPVRRLRRSDLRTLRLVTTHQGNTVPTVGGVLLFGARRAESFPDAWIQAGRFAGVDRTRIVDHTEIRANLVSSIEAAIGFIEKHSMRGAEIGRTRRSDTWTYPPVAVREAIVNAVAHADYSQRGAPIRISMFDDRLEIENPGLLPFGLTIDDVRAGISKLRNRVIGRVFHELGLIEQWGSGVQRMTAACRDAALPEPQFEEIATRFRVTLRATPTGTPHLDERDRAILDALQTESTADAGLRSSDVAEVLGVSARTARTRLARLVERGLVLEIGSGPNDPKRRYVAARS